jgi:kynureninase
MLELPEARPASAVVGRLREAGCARPISRGQTLRLSPGIITTEAGCDLLTEALSEVMRDS